MVWVMSFICIHTKTSPSNHEIRSFQLIEAWSDDHSLRTGPVEYVGQPARHDSASHSMSMTCSSAIILQFMTKNIGNKSKSYEVVQIVFKETMKSLENSINML